MDFDFTKCSLTDDEEPLASLPPMQRLQQEVVIIQPLNVLQTFSGKRGEEAGKFIHHFEQVADYNRWSIVERYCRLPMHLRRAAKDWFSTHYQSQSDAKDWRKTLGEMKRVFPSDKNLERERRLALREQRPGEELSKFYWSMKKLCEQVNPTMSDFEKRDRLINAMASPYNTLVALQSPSSCKELEDIINKIATVDDFRPQQPLSGLTEWEKGDTLEKLDIGFNAHKRWLERNENYQEARERILGQREQNVQLPW